MPIAMNEPILSQKVETFNHEQFGSIRTVNTDGEAWFCGKDVATALGYARPNNAIAQHCKGALKRGPLSTPGGTQEFTFITEPDVFRLIVSSKLPTAQKFEAWVFEEVLPSIRRTGGYMVTGADETPEETMARALLIAKEAMERKDARIAALEEKGKQSETIIEAQGNTIGKLTPKAQFADSVLSADGTYSITEASRLLKQVDPKMGQKKLFERLKADELITKQGNQATAKAIERGYLYNHKPDNRENPVTGEVKTFDPYARVTNKGLRWMVEHYCNPQAQLELEVL